MPRPFGSISNLFKNPAGAGDPITGKGSLSNKMGGAACEIGVSGARITDQPDIAANPALVGPFRALFDILKSITDFAMTRMGSRIDLPGINLVPASRFKTGQLSVTTAGTAQRLLDGPWTCRTIVIKALSDNNGFVYVQDSNTPASGIELSSGEAVGLDFDDPYKIWIDAETSGEGVSYFFLA